MGSSAKHVGTTEADVLVEGDLGCSSGATHLLRVLEGLLYTGTWAQLCVQFSKTEAIELAALNEVYKCLKFEASIEWKSI